MVRLISSSTTNATALPNDGLVRRALAPFVTLSVAAAIAACGPLSTGAPAGQPDGSTTATDDSGSPSQQPDSGGGTDQPDTGAAVADSGGQTGTTDAGGSAEAAAPIVCDAPKANTDTLPFAVDSKYGAYGYEPTGNDGLNLPASATCSGNRSSATALGSCHTVMWSPAAAPQGWAGVVWQFGNQNWGAKPGYLIPPGATKVSFWARGAVGGEVVNFAAGGMGTPSATTPCADTASASLKLQSLTTTWTHYTMPLTGTYANGVLSGFTFSIGIGDQPGDAGAVPVAGDAGDASAAAPITFYIDDMQWQM